MGVEQNVGQGMAADWVVLVEREGTVEALGLGLGSERRVLGWKGSIRSGPKAKLR